MTIWIWDLKETYAAVRLRDEKNLIQVMKDVFAYTGHPFVILIDEWDCLFREYKQNVDAQKAYLDFLRAWLKDKAYVALAYMTGYSASEEVWFPFCTQYVYRVFYDQSTGNGQNILALQKRK